MNQSIFSKFNGIKFISLLPKNTHSIWRGLSVANTQNKAITQDESIKKSVFISQSNNIFKNLALEEWIFRNMNLKTHHIMMLWRNNPCVVIGKFQNPWQEANVNFLKTQSIPLVRRNSGGGCVYHDLGNLNISFFSSRDKYDRMYNLEIIKRAIYRAYGIKTDINKRLDIMINDSYKISGTASKLGRDKAYHHCTLLVSTNKQNLKNALSNKMVGIESKATESVPSPVANLCQVNNSVKIDDLQTAIGVEYLRTHSLRLEDCGESHIAKQNGFHKVNPTNGWFAGLDDISNEFQSWDWRFGKTPTFTVSRTFPVPDEILGKPKPNSLPQELIIKMTVEKGIIEDVTLVIPPGMMDSGLYGQASVVTHLKGKRFSSESLSLLQDSMLQSKTDRTKKLGDKELFVAKCFDQVMNSV